MRSWAEELPGDSIFVEGREQAKSCRYVGLWPLGTGGEIRVTGAAGNVGRPGTCKTPYVKSKTGG